MIGIYNVIQLASNAHAICKSSSSRFARSNIDKVYKLFLNFVLQQKSKVQQRKKLFQIAVYYFSRNLLIFRSIKHPSQ